MALSRCQMTRATSSRTADDFIGRARPIATSNHSNLLTFAAAGRPSEAKCVLIRWLLDQGVDRRSCPAVTPPYLAASSAGWERAVELVSMLCEAAPLERQVASKMTPIRAALIHGFGRNTKDDDYSPSDTLEMVKVLLRHGAPLDDYASYAGGGGTGLTAGLVGGRKAFRLTLSAKRAFGETKFPQLAQNEGFVEAKALIAGVRACGGSWTSYCRLPHKELLRLRSLISPAARVQRRRTA